MRRKVLCTAGTVFQKGRKGCYRRRQLSLSGDGTVCKTGKEQSNRISEDRKLKIRTTFDGTRTDPKSSGSIQGLTSDNFTPEAFTYGILEGMGDELYQMYRTIKNGTGIQIKNLIGSGNGVRKNPVFCEMLEELFQNKLVLSAYKEEAAAGAAISSTLCS